MPTLRAVWAALHEVFEMYGIGAENAGGCVVGLGQPEGLNSRKARYGCWDIGPSGQLMFVVDGTSCRVG